MARLLALLILMPLTFIDFNSGASLASLGWTSISSSVTNTAGAGEDGSYAMKADTSIAAGGGSALYTVNYTKGRVRVKARWNRLYWTHSSGASLANFLTNGTAGLNSGFVASVTELGWSNYPSTPPVTLFSDGSSAVRTEAAMQLISGGSGGANQIFATGFPGTSSGWHDLIIDVVLSSAYTSGVASADGSIKLTIDGVVVHRVSGAKIPNPILAGVGAYSVEMITLAPIGILDDVEFSEDDAIDVPSPVNNATKCCNGMEGTTPSGSGISGGVEPNPYEPTDPPIYDCDGNGTIEDIDDPTRQELFA